MTLGERIKIAREEKGLSIRAVAREAGVSYSYLAKVERDLKVPSIVFLVKIKRVCTSIDIDYWAIVFENEVLSNHINMIFNQDEIKLINEFCNQEEISIIDYIRNTVMTKLNEDRRL